MTRSWWPLVVMAALMAAVTVDAAAQVILRPPPGVTIIEPTFEPPYHLTIRVYVETHDGRRLAPGLGASVLVTDPQGRRVGMDASGALLGEVPNARWEPVLNAEPNAPIGPRGLTGSGIVLEAPPDGRYRLEVAGTDRVGFDLAVAQWDRMGRRRWLDLRKGATESGAVDRYELAYTSALRPAIDVTEPREQSYLSLRAYGRRADGDQEPVTELLLTDPRGRRLGLEPNTQRRHAEVPRAGYDEGTGPVPGRELEILRPVDGAYTLEVIGTHAGRYDLSMYANDTDGQPTTSGVELSDIPTGPGLIHRYAFEYASTPPASPTRIAGAYGDGERLLTYAYPTGPRTEVVAGQASVSLILFYAHTIVQESFRATLDGRDVSAHFRPTPGGRAVVTLPLAPGTTALVLSVSAAMAGGQTSTQTDRLEFVRR
jgi:hypothetical protein